MKDEGNVLLETPIFNVVARKGRVFVDRNNNTGLVKIIPVTEDGNLILISQWREPIQKKTIEFPAGVAGDKSNLKEESLVEAAARELLEETGYVAENMVKVHQGPISPSISTDILTTFIASKLSLKQEPKEDTITVYKVGISDVYHWLYDQRLKDFAVDEKVYSGIYLTQMFLQQKKEEKEKGDGLPQAES